MAAISTREAIPSCFVAFSAVLGFRLSLWLIPGHVWSIFGPNILVSPRNPELAMVRAVLPPQATPDLPPDALWAAVPWCTYGHVSG